MIARARKAALLALGCWPLACAVYEAPSLDAGGDTSAGRAGAVTLPASGAASPGSAASGGQQNASGGLAGASAGGTPNPEMSGHGGAETSGDAGENAGGDAATGGTRNGGSGGGDGGVHAGGVGGSSYGGALGTGGSNGGAGAGGSMSNAGSVGAAGTANVGGATGNGGVAGNSGAAGNGGAAGAPSQTCALHPLTPRSSWLATASDDSGGKTPASAVLDGKTTRWTTGKPQAGDEWLQIDFGASVNFNHVNLQQGPDSNDYPRTYALIVSEMPNDLNASPNVSGMGKSGVSTAVALSQFASGRYLLIKQLGNSLSWWSAQEIEVSCAE